MPCATFQIKLTCSHEHSTLNWPVLLKTLLRSNHLRDYLTLLQAWWLTFYETNLRKLRWTFIVDCAATLGTRRACNTSKDAACIPLYFLLKAILPQNSVCSPKSFFLRNVSAISSPKSSSKNDRRLSATTTLPSFALQRRVAPLKKRKALI